MTADEVKKTLDGGIATTGVKAEVVVRRPPLLSDNGHCYISEHLKDYLKE